MSNGWHGNFCLVFRDHKKNFSEQHRTSTGLLCGKFHLEADHCRRCMGESSNHLAPKRRGYQLARAYRRPEVSNKVSNSAGTQTELHRVLLQAQVAGIGQASNITEIKRKRFRDQFHSPFEWMTQMKPRDKVLRRGSPQQIQVPTASRACRQTSTTRLMHTTRWKWKIPTSSSRWPHVLKARFPKRWGDWRGGISAIHCSRVSRSTSNLSTDFFFPAETREPIKKLHKAYLTADFWSPG